MGENGYLLDTNIAIALLANEEAALAFVRKANEEKKRIYFSVISECEVFSGLSSEYELQGVKLFNPRRCLHVHSEIARLAGKIRRDQKAKGRRLKTPDALIIATALEHRLTLVSRDSDMVFVQSEYGLPMLKI